MLFQEHPACHSLLLTSAWNPVARVDTGTDGPPPTTTIGGGGAVYIGAVRCLLGCELGVVCALECFRKAGGAQKGPACCTSTAHRVLTLVADREIGHRSPTVPSSPTSDGKYFQVLIVRLLSSVAARRLGGHIYSGKPGHGRPLDLLRTTLRKPGMVPNGKDRTRR